MTAAFEAYHAMDTVLEFVRAGRRVLVLCIGCDNSPYVRINGSGEHFPGRVLSRCLTTDFFTRGGYDAFMSLAPDVVIFDFNRQLHVVKETQGGAELGSIDVELCEHHPPGHIGGLHATHGKMGLWYAGALLSACGVQGEVGQELRIVIERKGD